MRPEYLYCSERLQSQFIDPLINRPVEQVIPTANGYSLFENLPILAFYAVPLKHELVSRKERKLHLVSLIKKEFTKYAIPSNILLERYSTDRPVVSRTASEPIYLGRLK